MGEGLFQPWHLAVILVIALLIFGPKRLPQLGRSLGEGIKALKTSISFGKRNSDGAKQERDQLSS